MANASYRVNPDILKADLEGLAAIRRLTNYKPVNPQASLENLERVLTLLLAAQERSSAANDEAAAARDALQMAEWAVHDLMLIGKTQVQAQYGFDSDEVQSLGLKKKSKRRRNAPREA
jgi:hypothetical protein